MFILMLFTVLLYILNSYFIFIAAISLIKKKSIGYLLAPMMVIFAIITNIDFLTNDIFSFKHHFVLHTLEDNVLLDILKAMREKRKIRFINESMRLRNKNTYQGVPLEIFISTQTGRRYVNIYNEYRNGFIDHRLYYVKSVKILDVCENY